MICRAGNTESRQVCPGCLPCFLRHAAGAAAVSRRDAIDTPGHGCGWRMPMRGTNPDRHGPPGMNTRAYSLPLALCTAALLAACGSSPKQQQAAEAAAEAPAAQ